MTDASSEGDHLNDLNNLRHLENEGFSVSSDSFRKQTVVEQNSAVIQQLDIGVIFLQGGRDEVF